MTEVFSCGAIICAAGALLLGCLVSVLNARLTSKHKDDEINRLAAISFLRTLISFAFLAAVFFAVRAMGYDFLLPMLAAALGLTVPAIIMAIKTAEEFKKGDDSNG